MVPEPVQDLQITSNPHIPSVCLTWKPPANYARSEHMLHYYIKITPKMGGEAIEMETKGQETSVEWTSEKLQPLQEYIFAVQGVCSDQVVGDWNMMDGFMGG